VPAKNEKADLKAKGGAAAAQKGQEQLSEIGQINNVNQISSEVEIRNTEFHKSIMKARNENFNEFKTRFQTSITRIMGTYDESRREEKAFNKYWNENLKEITVKHI
jgi:hypothetical protein